MVELVAEMQYALDEFGERPSPVEVFAAGAGLAPYHEAAIAAATLVWADPPETVVDLARVFDGANAGGPFFSPDHPRLEGDGRERLLAYLRAGEALLSTTNTMDDVVDRGQGAVVPLNYRSDGRWIWTDAVAYYLDRHHLAPDPGLTAHVLGAPARPAPLGWLGRHRALAALAAPADWEPVWSAG